MLPRRGVIEGHFTWFGRWVELPASYWYTTKRWNVRFSVLRACLDEVQLPEQSENNINDIKVLDFHHAI